MHSRTIQACCALMAVGISTCVPPGPQPKQVTDRESIGNVMTEEGEFNHWSDCYARFTPTGNPRGDLERITRACAQSSEMRPVTKALTQTQSEKDPADRYTFYVPKAGSCYRVFATGEKTISDLDVLLRGPDGENVAADLTHDSWPVAPPAGPACFDTPGLYMVEVSVFQGEGTYAFQVWGN